MYRITPSLLSAGLFAAGLACSSLASAQSTPAAPTSSRPSGYIPSQALPNSLTLLSPAPDAHSATQARDDAAEAAAEAYRHGPRWSLAALDADLSFPNAAGTFACTLGVDISQETTPRLYALLQRVRADTGAATALAKDKYNRQRPFVVVGGPTCRPEDESYLRSNGSYPSGHSTTGWGWALVLAEADPQDENAILNRGRAFLQSRVVCNVHWLSDTEAGSLLASSVVAREHDEPAFEDDLAASKAEIIAARAAHKTPARDCAAEAAAIQSAPNLQP